MNVLPEGVPPPVPTAFSRETRSTLETSIFAAIVERNAHAHLLARAEATLRLLASFRGLRRDHIEALLLDGAAVAAGSRRVVANRLLRGLCRRGLVEYVLLPTRGGTVPVRGYVLTADGERVYAASDPTYPPRRTRRALSALLIEHALCLADVAVALRDAARTAGVAMRWESDFEATACLGSILVIPDALATFERHTWRVRAFIEADRSTEHEQAFARKVRRYVELYLSGRWRTQFRSWPIVLTVTTSDAHARALARVAARVTDASGGGRITRGFRFAALDELQRGHAFERMWHVAGGRERVDIFGEDDPPRATREAEQ